MSPATAQPLDPPGNAVIMGRLPGHTRGLFGSRHLPNALPCPEPTT